MKRLTIRVGEVEVGDRLDNWQRVTDVVLCYVPYGNEVESVEIFTDRDPLGMPVATFDPSDPIEVWR